MTLTDGDGQLVMSGIHTYGEAVHLFIERENYHGVFMPGFRAVGIDLQCARDRPPLR